MSTGGDFLLKELRQLISEDGSKLEKLQRAATLMRNSGTYSLAARGDDAGHVIRREMRRLLFCRPLALKTVKDQNWWAA
jgi:hypothetical protein